jgi:hypothetical protein
MEPKRGDANRARKTGFGGTVRRLVGRRLGRYFSGKVPVGRAWQVASRRPHGALS